MRMLIIIIIFFIIIMENSWEKVKNAIEHKPKAKKNLAEQIEKNKSIVMTNPEMAKYLLSLNKSHLLEIQVSI